MTIHETIDFLLDYKVKCDAYEVKEWIYQEKLKATKTKKGYTVEIGDVWDFLDDLRLTGTAYERGIDDKTKIERLEKEIDNLNETIDTLVYEKIMLEFELGISPFN